MARINIEDSLYTDARFYELVSLVGSLDTAIGSLVRAFIVAQKYWRKDKSLIPEAEWSKQKLNKALLDCGFASFRNGSYYVHGSEEQFEWLVKKQESGRKGGKVSGESRRNDSNNLERSNASKNEAKASKTNPLTLTHSLTHSLTPTLTLSQTQSRSRNILPASLKAEKEVNKKIWESYFNAYRLRYGVEPVRNATVNTQISNLRKRLGEEACKVVEFYLSHNDSFYLKSTHSVGLCLKDCESLRTQMLRGTAITNSMVKSFEKRNKTAETLAELDKLWSEENVD